jgi:DNA-binding transcriptional ArsR family regulator
MTPLTKKAESAHQREQARAKALSSPLRHQIFLILAEREATPKELAEELGEPLANVQYHVRWLAGDKPANSVPLIELIKTDRKHGGLQHIWRAIERPLINMEAAAQMPQPVRERVTATLAPRVVDDINGAIEAGTIDAHPQRSILRYHAHLDEKGMLQAAAASEAYLRELEAIAGDSQNRIAGGSRGFPVATETLIFPIPSPYWTGR